MWGKQRNLILSEKIRTKPFSRDFIFIYLFFFETHVAQDGFELTLWLRLLLNSVSFVLGGRSMDWE